MELGRHHAVWQGKHDSGPALTSGVYFARLEPGEEVSEHRMVVLK